MASVDMVGLLGGGVGVRARPSGAEVGGLRAAVAPTGTGAVPGSGAARGRTRSRRRRCGWSTGAAPRRGATPRTGAPRTGRRSRGSDALGREQHRSGVGVVGQQGRHRPAARVTARGEHEAGDPAEAGGGEEEVPAAAVDRHPDGEAVDVGQAVGQPDRAGAPYDDVVLALARRARPRRSARPSRAGRSGRGRPRRRGGAACGRDAARRRPGWRRPARHRRPRPPPAAGSTQHRAEPLPDAVGAERGVERRRRPPPGRRR